MPHIALAMQNNGDISVCNICKTNLQINDKPSTIENNSIQDFWNSNTRFKIINELDNGIEHTGCNECFNKEKSGNLSNRQNFNETFKNLVIKDEPQVLIIKPGNTCNSACRTCVPETSTSLYSDYYKLFLEKNPNVKFNQYIKKFENVRKSFSENNLNFWPAINNWYKNLNYMDIYGGEPWLTKSLWKSLQFAVDNNYAKDISLGFHTNAMSWDDSYIELLKNFKKVKIGLSIDSHIEQEFNYIRHKSDFKTVIKNSKKFVEVTKSFPNIECAITITTSILNVYNLDEIFYYLKEQFDININFTNYVTYPDYLDIRHLPVEIKKIIIKKFENTPLENVSDFMNSPIQGCEIYWPKFCMETDKFDRIREQSFALTFPKWYGILEPYWDYKKRHSNWYGTV